MGNEAIALAVVNSGCSVVTSYPGTPASEILSTVSNLISINHSKIHAEWSVNEKSAFEVALSNSYLGGRSAVAMKQVGLNVAADSLMSSAYTGVIGGLLIIAADDPGPHSSQTEQDSRFMAMLAKIPVFDPSSPQDAYSMIRKAFDISEKYRIPLMLRPTTRVCHARQNVAHSSRPITLERPIEFIRDPTRWAATPRYRYILHKQLNLKLDRISREANAKPIIVNKLTKCKYCIISSGVSFSYIMDLLQELSLNEMAVLIKVPVPYPLSNMFLQSVTDKFDKIMVVEETYPVIELQLPHRKNVFGRLNGFIPKEGELSPDVLYPLLNRFIGNKYKRRTKIKASLGQRPSLCAGCPHRATFFAIRSALPKAIYAGDIGCYTLGINIGAVDTCLCMGASINQAAGFYQSFKVAGGKMHPIVAAIGDSTFIHAGIPALINSVYNNARFIIVILDNATTAMTGNQPTAATGVLANGSSGTGLPLEDILKGCGLKFLKIVDSYDVPNLISVLKDAEAFTLSGEGGIAAVIARHNCIMHTKMEKKYIMKVSSNCTGCQYCITNFECPALVQSKKHITINHTLCSGCGVCIHVCPVKAIQVQL